MTIILNFTFKYDGRFIGLDVISSSWIKDLIQRFVLVRVYDVWSFTMQFHNSQFQGRLVWHFTLQIEEWPTHACCAHRVPSDIFKKWLFSGTRVQSHADWIGFLNINPNQFWKLAIFVLYWSILSKYSKYH